MIKNQKSLKIGEMCQREDKDLGGEAGEVAGGIKSDRHHGLGWCWGVCG